MSMTTSVPERRSAVSSLRLRAAVPHTDESLSSAIDRVASLWSVSRQELLRQLGHAPSAEELDAIVSRPLLESMARAFGTESCVLEALAVPRDRLEVLVAPRIRHAYCPLCMEDDWRSGHTPYFRLDWGRLWLTHCRVHQTPLFEWMGRSFYGQRRLPHEFHLPYDALAKLPVWINNHVREARAWRNAAMMGDPSHDLWRALIKVESAWWAAGVGEPRSGTTAAPLRRERILSKLAVLFLATPHSAQPCLAGRLHVPAHQHHVLGYDRRRHRSSVGNPGWQLFRATVPVLPARRAVLILTAHTLGQLDASPRFESGAAMPSGSSGQWAAEVLAQRHRRHLAEASLRTKDDW